MQQKNPSETKYFPNKCGSQEGRWGACALSLTKAAREFSQSALSLPPSHGIPSKRGFTGHEFRIFSQFFSKYFADVAETGVARERKRRGACGDSRPNRFQAGLLFSESQAHSACRFCCQLVPKLRLGMFLSKLRFAKLIGLSNASRRSRSLREGIFVGRRSKEAELPTGRSQAELGNELKRGHWVCAGDSERSRRVF
jgi:hypothetical protein